MQIDYIEPEPVNVIPGSIGDALLEGEQRLRYAETLRPRRHAELLLQYVMSLDRTQLYINARTMLTNSQKEQFLILVKQREAGIPVQYLVKWAPFYGREFKIEEEVFIPRFETEILIDRLISDYTHNYKRSEPVQIIDLCCGSGIIGITTALELPAAEVTMAELSQSAIECSQQNAAKFDVHNRTEIVELNALDEFPVEWTDRFDYVLGNPPYIAAADLPGLPPDVRNGEPTIALTDNGDGLSFYRKWAVTVPCILKPKGKLAVECGINEADEIAEIFSTSFSDIVITKDFDGIKRTVEGRRK